MAQDNVREVRDRTDIIELVGSYVSLKKAGRSYKGLCPFHQEKTPSFVVFPDSQNFHCFGCGKGGDALTFYMQVEHVEFREALQELARRAGIELASIPTIAPEVDAHRQRLIELNELAAVYFANVLNNSEAGAPGRTVVERRGLLPEVVQQFGLGFALERWDGLHTYLASRGVDPTVAVEAGLLSERKEGAGYYDRFRNRLMFPIRTREGRTVGFGARALGDDQPKYLNSPQSAVFDKGSLVYGLDLAQSAIRAADRVVIVEGYMDVIAAHQFGYANVVATMGTAVTETQIGLVKRLSKHIVLALDADNAGQLATLRSLETLPAALDSEAVPMAAPQRGPAAGAIIRWERKLSADVAIVRLPEGKDPDELIRRDPARWPEVVEQARPFLDFFIEGVTADLSLDDARAKSEAIKRIAPLLQQVGDRVVQAHYTGVLARRLQLPETVVQSELRRGTLRTAMAVDPHSRPASSRAPQQASQEDHLVALLLRHREICRPILGLVPEDDLIDVRNRELLRVLRDEEIPFALEPPAIIAGLDDELADHAERLLASLAGTPAQYPGHIERDAARAVERLGKERFQFLMRQLQAAIEAAQQAGDAATLQSLIDQLALLHARHRQFYPPPSPYFRDSRSTSLPTTG
ncbi:MAG: DNA primase [Chloroflexota bacterium]|nr:DNA primase [Chloroflexota bacterium]